MILAQLFFCNGVFAAGMSQRPRSADAFRLFFYRAMQAEKLDALLHIWRKRGFKFHQLAGCGMFEFERVGMQRRAVDDRVFGDRLDIFQLPRIDKFAAVHIVADNGVFDM